MCWANWMSLGIIVTLFACMVQRFMSSMRPTIYASAASCKHIIVCLWKCSSYLPTSRVILQTNCEKGSFQIRSSVLFWCCQISQRATVPGQYFLVFLTLLAFKNSFWGALPPTVDQSFFLASSSPPDIDGLASTAIWANCWVSNDCGDLPTSSSHSTSAILFIISSASGGVCGAGDVGCTGDEGPFAFSSTCTTACILSILIPPFSSFLGVTLVLAILEFRQGESTNRKAVRFWSCKSYVAAILNFQLVCHHFFGKVLLFTYFVLKRK